nr:hypothetical protein [Bacteroidaceae bacterium]
MEYVIDSDVRLSIGGNGQRVHTKDTTYSDVMFKHILLPLWVGAFKIEDKTYQFVIDGRSGKVYGEYPKDKLKVAIVVLGIILLFVLFYYFMSNA